MGAARRKWADYQRILAEAPDNRIAAAIRERGLADMVPHLVAAYDGLWTEVEAWLKARRDHTMQGYGVAWFALDAALDDLRDHMATGTHWTSRCTPPPTTPRRTSAPTVNAAAATAACAVNVRADPARAPKADPRPDEPRRRTPT